MCGSFRLGRDQLKWKKPLILSIALLTASFAPFILSEKALLISDSFDLAVDKVSPSLPPVVRLITSKPAFQIDLYPSIAVEMTPLIPPPCCCTTDLIPDHAVLVLDFSVFHAFVILVLIPLKVVVAPDFMPFQILEADVLMLFHAVLVPVFTAFQAFVMLVLIPLKIVVAPDFIPFQTLEAAVLMLFHAVLVPVFTAFQAFVIPVLIPLKMVVAPVFMPFHTVETPLLMPFQAVSVPDLIPFQRPVKKVPSPSPTFFTPEHTLSQTPLNHSEISPQCLMISTTATTAATTPAMIPIMGSRDRELNAVSPVERPPTEVMTLPITPVMLPAADTTFPTPTRMGPTAAATRAAFTMNCCMGSGRSFQKSENFFSAAAACSSMGARTLAREFPTSAPVIFS